jgi:hypothetical protein
MKLLEIITDEKVGSVPMDPDPEVTRLRQALRKFSLMPAGPEFDGAYFRFQVEHYANHLGVLIASRGNAHDDDFESFIDSTRPRLEQRREAAFAILSTMAQR